MIGLALLAGTIRSIKQNLVRRPADQARLIAVVFFDIFEGLLWAGCLLALIAAAPHPVSVVIVSLFLASMATASTLRYQEEKQSLNRWLRMSADMGGSLPGLLDGVANGCRSRLARRAKACTRRLNRGESLADAARRAKLPLDAATVAAIMIPKAIPESKSNSSSREHRVESGIQFRRDHERWRTNALVIQQFSYVVVTMTLAWLIGRLVRSVIVPLFEQMFDEMEPGTSLYQSGLDTVVWIGDVVVAAMIVWLVLFLLIRWLPPGIVSWVPWFGARAIDQGRCEVLGTLQRGMRVSQPVTETLEHAMRATRAWWIRSRCRVVHRLVESGIPLVVAMKRGKLVTGREQKWLTCAENNGTMPDALSRLCDDIKRRQTHRWRIRMAWWVPLGTVLVAGFVLAHAVFLFHFLIALISGMTLNPESIP